MYYIIAQFWFVMATQTHWINSLMVLVFFMRFVDHKEHFEYFQPYPLRPVLIIFTYCFITH